MKPSSDIKRQKQKKKKIYKKEEEEALFKGIRVQLVNYTSKIS
jgi:hypothetical protein